MNTEEKGNQNSLDIIHKKRNEKHGRPNDRYQHRERAHPRRDDRIKTAKLEWGTTLKPQLNVIEIPQG